MRSFFVTCLIYERSHPKGTEIFRSVGCCDGDSQEQVLGHVITAAQKKFDFEHKPGDPRWKLSSHQVLPVDDEYLLDYLVRNGSAVRVPWEEEKDRQDEPAGLGAGLIALERISQQREKGFTREHDKQHANRGLVKAALCYLADDLDKDFEYTPTAWPFEVADWKPAGTIRNLVRAGALIAAEIDRLLAIEAEKEAVQPVKQDTKQPEATTVAAEVAT